MDALLSNERGPLPFVIDVHSLFALSRGFDHGPVRVDDGLFEKLIGLLLPDLEAGLVEDFHQDQARQGIEAPAEVSGRRGIRNPLCAQSVQVNLVVPEQFEVFQARASGQQVVGDIQDMVGFGIRPVELESLHRGIDHVVETESSHHGMNEADAAGADCASACGDVIVNVGRREDGTFLWKAVPIDTSRDAMRRLLRSSQFRMVMFTRKPSVSVECVEPATTLTPENTDGSHVFPLNPTKHHTSLRWFKG